MKRRPRAARTAATVLVNAPLSTADFVYRARAVQAAKLGAVDEPGVPGGLGRQTYGELMRRADGFVEALDRLGIGQGERIAIVSPNSVKFLIALWAATGSGRVLVPINFRLDADEVSYIVEDAEASLLLVDPELAEKLATVRVPRRIVLDGDDDAELFAPSDSGLEWPGSRRTRRRRSTTPRARPRRRRA